MEASNVQKIAESILENVIENIDSETRLSKKVFMQPDHKSLVISVMRKAMEDAESGACLGYHLGHVWGIILGMSGVLSL